MSGFVGVNVSNCQEPADTDPSLRGQLTQVELQSLKLKLSSLKWDSGGRVTTKNLPGLMNKLRGLEVVSEEEIAAFLSESYYPDDQEIDFESFLQLYLDLQARVSTDKCGGGIGKTLFSLTKPSMVQADKS